MSAKRVVAVLADGFEEAEAIVPIDVLRRLGIEVVVAGLETETVRGSHNIVVKAETLLANVPLDGVDAVMLPGGMPGSNNLRASEPLMAFLKKASGKGAIVSAICAAPIALGRAGLLKGKAATSYPGFEDKLEGARYTGARVERDGSVVTAKGAGASFEFAAALAVALGKSEAEVKKVLDSMFVAS